MSEEDPSVLDILDLLEEIVAESTMDTYNNSSTKTHGALDFTAAAMNDSKDTSVLDLSCKKQESSQQKDHQMSSSCVLSPISCGASNSPTMENPSQRNCSDENSVGNYGDDERKSPFEGRTFMVTPPSETDSPKKFKYEAMDQNGRSPPTSPNDSMNNRYSILPMGVPMSLVVPAVLPNLLENQNVNQTINPMMQIPASMSATSSPIPHQVASPLTSPEMGKKAPRPFKAYPKDPLSLTMGSAEMVYDPNSNEAYSEFRKRMLDSVRRTNEGTNIKMRRVSKSPGLPTSTMDDKDAAYWERRRKNNEAAKRSRDARRAKEDEIAIRAAFLEQENMKLKYELVALRNETAKLRCMIYTN